MSTEPKSETTDLLADLRELASYAGRLQDVIATAQRTVPAGAQGHDATGTVSAEVDALGSPLSLRVETGWEYRLDARDLGAAATEAYQQAVQRHLQEWSEDLNRQGWQYDIRDFDESTAQHPAPPIQAPTPSDTGEARSVDALVSDLIAELDFAIEALRAGVQGERDPDTGSIDRCSHRRRVGHRQGSGLAERRTGRWTAVRPTPRTRVADHFAACR